LTGLEEINHHTLSDFRVAHQEALNELFVQILGVLSYEGLITLERVMHDGTKVKAYAADKSFRREGTLQKHLEAARQQVEEMGDPRSEEVSERVAKARERAIREKQERLEAALEELQRLQAEARSKKEKPLRVSMTDPEARIMKQADGGFAPNYNVQVSSDAKADMIVGIGVSQAANDTAELVPAVKRMEANMGESPQQVVVDGGFMNQGAIGRTMRARRWRRLKNGAWLRSFFLRLLRMMQNGIVTSVQRAAIWLLRVRRRARVRLGTGIGPGWRIARDVLRKGSVVPRVKGVRWCVRKSRRK
jgi:hypothetical protein